MRGYIHATKNGWVVVPANQKSLPNPNVSEKDAWDFDVYEGKHVEFDLDKSGFVTLKPTRSNVKSDTKTT